MTKALVLVLLGAAALTASVSTSTLPSFILAPLGGFAIGMGLNIILRGT
jgi:hypothetical protein